MNQHNVKRDSRKLDETEQVLIRVRAHIRARQYTSAEKAIDNELRRRRRLREESKI